MTALGEGLLTIITLTTDFGLRDGKVGVMKGVIWGICPEARIADLGHMIGPQNIAEAALLIFRSVPYFPPGSIHVVVVDPGVGTARRPASASESATASMSLSGALDGYPIRQIADRAAFQSHVH